MKFTTPIFAAAATLIASAAAELYITVPDEDTVWAAGQPGYIAWNTSASEFGLMCDIQLIDVATTEAVMNITNQSIPCSINQFNTTPLPVMENDEFMVRIGETNNKTIWSYTQNFKILNGSQNDGNATIPLGNSTSVDNGDNEEEQQEDNNGEEQSTEEEKPEEEKSEEETEEKDEDKEDKKEKKKDKKKDKKKHKKDEDEEADDEE